MSCSNEDLAANQVFHELRQDIVSFIDVDTFVPLLHKKRWLTLRKLQYLENPRSGLTELERKHYLVNHCLMDKGSSALQTLLEVLDETSKLYEPHEKLSVKIKQHYCDVFDRISQETHASCPNRSNPSTPMPAETVTTCVSSMPDLVPQPSHLPIHSSRPRSESTSSHHRSHGSTAAPAHHYYVKVIGPSASSEYLSASLNNPTGFKGADSSLVETYEPTEETTHKHEVDDSLQCDVSKAATSKSQNKQNSSYDEPPVMFAGITETEQQKERRKAAVKIQCGVTSTLEVSKSTCLSEYDVVSRLQLSADPLSNMIHMKLILLGSSGVGKTSLIIRFLHKHFWQTQTTVAVDHNHCYVHYLSKQVNVSLTMLDTAGQERFDSICTNYYRDVDAVLMVFDMTNQDSLDEVEYRWVKQLKQHLSSTDVPVLLVGNKSDERVNISRGIRTQAKEMVRQFSFIDFMEGSAKDGHEVDAIFERIISVAVTRLLEFRGDENTNIITLDPPTFTTRQRRCC